MKNYFKMMPIVLKPSLAIGFLLITLFLAGLFEYPELGTIDLRYRLRQPLNPHSDIAVVGITTRCLAKMGKFPWMRTVYKPVLDYLKSADAKIIAVDIIFPEPDPAPGADESLGIALGNAGNCILPVFAPHRFQDIAGPANFISADFIEESIPLLSKNALTQAHINLIPDADGIYRKVPLGIEYKNKVYLPLALEAPLRAMGLGPSRIAWSKTKATFGDSDIPLHQSKFTYINLFDSKKHFPVYAFSDVLSGSVPRENFKDKIILIGQVTQGLPNADIVTTSFGEKYGVILQANIINTFLSGKYISRAPKLIICLIMLTLVLLLPLITVRLRPAVQVLLLISELAILFVTAGYFFSANGIIVDIVPLSVCLLSVFAFSLIARVKFADEIVQKKELELDSILEAGKLTAQGLESGKTADVIAGTLINAIGTRGLILRWRDAQDKEMKIISVFGLGTQVQKEPFVNPDTVLAEEVARTQQPVLISNTRKDEKFSLYAEAGIHSAMCAPLILKDQVKGTATLYDKISTDKSTTAFIEDDLKLLTILASQATIALENETLFGEVEQIFLSSIKSLAEAIDAKDPYTHGHSERVTADVSAIARELKLSEAEKKDLMIVAILHDVGKIGVKEVLLQKPAPLTSKEKELFNKHSEIGSKIMSPIKELEGLMPAIRHHHESYDGKGYPDGLKAKKIPLYSRIIAVADTFDAMTSDRPYRKALSDRAAREEINKLSGIQFDPQVVEAFNRAYQKSKVRRA